MNEIPIEDIRKAMFDLTLPIARLDGERAEMELRKDGPKLQRCRGCGKLSENRWCSNGCFIQEDGYDEEAWK